MVYIPSILYSLDIYRSGPEPSVCPVSCVYITCRTTMIVCPMTVTHVHPRTMIVHPMTVTHVHPHTMIVQ